METVRHVRDGRFIVLCPEDRQDMPSDAVWLDGGVVAHWVRSERGWYVACDEGDLGDGATGVFTDDDFTGWTELPLPSALSPDLPPAAGAGVAWREAVARMVWNFRIGEPLGTEAYWRDAVELAERYPASEDACAVVDYCYQFADAIAALTTPDEVAAARLKAVEAANERLARLGHVIERERDEAVDRIANLLGELEAAEARATALEQRLALSAAPPPADSGWRPIETCPHDTPVLLLGANGLIGIGGIAHYEPAGGEPFNVAKVAYAENEPTVGGKRRVAVFLPSYSPDTQPIAWQPPPPADHDASEGRGGSSSSSASLPSSREGSDPQAQSQAGGREP